MNIVKQKVKVAVCTTLLALGTFSCQKDLLDPVPKTLFSDQVVFDTPARIELQVNGLYSFVKVGNFLGGRYQIYGDIRADDFINRTSNAVTGLSVWNHTITETSQNDVINLWTAAYGAINQINVFLAGLDANAAKYVAPTFKADFATTTAVNYKAEARLLRALSYYSLLQFYARPYADGNGSKPGLPLRLQAETNATGNELARSTVAEVYTQILADLDYAETNLPLTNGSAPLNVTRAHRNTAIALKTRVYLSMGRYADVIKEANKIVPTAAPFAAATGVPNALNASIATVFAAPQETTESILSFPFTAQNAPGTQNQLAYYFAPAPIGNGEYSLNPNGILANAGFAATDVRRTSLVTKSGTEFFLNKYPTGTPYTDKAPVIRYAEVLLNLAEARFRTAGAADPQALALLNAVRGRSNPAGIYPAFAATDAAVNAILLERRIEFLGEGIRNNDLMRLNATIPGKGSVGAIAPTNTLYVWPIPATEIATNSLVVRN
ncbi:MULTISPECIES: RagB/SusD family nutrient uptake outer membrane protein [Hymenobacter]|uniref:RagB/SusD family nutrient uptake outer membrane protein n=1 Tax=Hymenobacter jejuensis TaxID=2502781 RepID=A0A5B7ZVF0_9BACT|nr:MULTISPECIES: RagB/SusD family nutrient uptake outer membrane protein [Hymenobacter]MBC6988451.1 RagB/SusD family nutrient uptake outer membrane protein [Hymenobacter sp. BT491]QDA59194.1 RagB/SusD family nutrient uptake outer membrane protein [Hymenobacter jejuensis]